MSVSPRVEQQNVGDRPRVWRAHWSNGPRYRGAKRAPRSLTITGLLSIAKPFFAEDDVPAPSLSQWSSSRCGYEFPDLVRPGPHNHRRCPRQLRTLASLWKTPELEQVTISHDRLAADPAGPRPWIEHRTAPSQLRPPSACRTGRDWRAGTRKKSHDLSDVVGPPESPESRRICDPVDKCRILSFEEHRSRYRAGCDRL